MKCRANVIRRMTLLIFLSVSSLFVHAQSNLLFYHSPEQFNSSNYNPAFLVSQGKYTFSVFPLSGMNVSYNNQSIINKVIKNVLQKDTENEASKALFKSLVEKGLFYQRFESLLLFAGYTNPEYGSFNFRVKEIEQLLIDFKGDFTNFILNPSNHPLYINQAQDLPAKAYHYREYSFGYAKTIIPDKLIFGIRAKLYYGKASFVSEANGIATYAEDTFSIKTYGQLKLSAPVKTIIDNEVLQPFVLNDNFSAGNYLLNTKNIGVGIDLGFSYNINSKLTFSASIIDLGSIKWKNNLSTLNLAGEVNIEMSQITASGTEFIMNTPDFTASMEGNFDLFKVKPTQAEYTTQLPANYYFGLNYRSNPNFSIGIVDRFISSKGMNHNSILLSTQFDLKKNLTITTGYSIIGNSYFNIPLGLIYQRESGQTYFGFDNIFSFLLPSVSDYTGITFGTCFYLFRGKVKYKDLEYLPFYKEKKRRFFK